MILQLSYGKELNTMGHTATILFQQCSSSLILALYSQIMIYGCMK